MAEKRMFSKRIIDSARFIKMPLSTQALYFHLGLHADDDGIVEAYIIMRNLGATEDELKILAAKNFVKVLNDELVTFVTDWQEHNLIRADRKIDSIYKNLLLQVVGENILLKEKKPRSDTIQGRNEILQIQAGQSIVSPRTDNGQHRLGKVRLDKVSNEDGLFEKFWEIYPKKTAKKDAMRAFNKINTDAEVLNAIMHAVVSLKKTEQWQKGFIPNPATFLNGERWKDEIPAERSQSQDEAVEAYKQRMKERGYAKE